MVKGKILGSLCQSTRHLVACCVKSRFGLSSRRQMKLCKNNLKDVKFSLIGNLKDVHRYHKHMQTLYIVVPLS